MTAGGAIRAPTAILGSGGGGGDGGRTARMKQWAVEHRSTSRAAATTTVSTLSVEGHASDPTPMTNTGPVSGAGGTAP